MLKGVWFCGVCFFLLVSCVSTPTEDKTQDINESRDISEGTAIFAPVKTEPAQDDFSVYFGVIDLNTLLLIQKGSPTAIREAVAALRNSNQNHSEQAKVLLAICASIMKHAWPSEKITWAVPVDLPDNVYTSTLTSIDLGVYESAFDDSDFFSLTLPSLVLLSAPSITNYYAEAQKSLAEAIELNADSVLTLYLTGILNLRMGNYDDAVINLKTAWDNDSDNMNIVYPYLTSLLELSRAPEVFELVTRLIAANPMDIKLLKLYAEAAYHIEDYVTAESLIAQILQREPDSVHFLLFRAYILFQLKEYLTVSTLLDIYARNNKTNKDYLLLRAQLQSVWNKNTTAALRTIQEALVLYPDDKDVILLAAELASASGQIILGKTPSDLLLSILKDDPNNMGALAIWIKEATAKKNWQEAYDASSIVVQSDGLTLESAIIHTEISIELNLLNEARKTIETFYTPDTDNENLQQWYIRLLIAEGKNAEARALISRLLPDATGRMRSILYFERSRLAISDTEILADLRSSLTANPRNEFALYNIYEYYYDRNDYSKAQYYLKQAISLNPSDAELLQRNKELDELLQ